MVASPIPRATLTRSSFLITATIAEHALQLNGTTHSPAGGLAFWLTCMMDEPATGSLADVRELG
jgi:hypothetical protein